MVIIFYFNVTHLIYDQRNHVSLCKAVHQARLLCCFIKFHIFTQRRSTFLLHTGSWHQTEGTMGRRDPFNHGSLQSASHRRPRQKLAVSCASRCAQRAARGQKVPDIRHVLSSAFLMLHEHFPYRNSERWAGVSRLPAIQLDLVSDRPSLGARG